jgi:nucleoside 2-deoxyribosyltransferase
MATNMNITLCGSIAFLPEMQELKTRLEHVGYDVKLPLEELTDDAGNVISAAEYYAIRHAATKDDTWVWERKAEAIRTHFRKIEWSDAIIVVNPKRRDIEGYIGGNTLMEMGLAFHLSKPIYLMYPIPELPYTEEMRGMRPIVLDAIESLK